MFNLFKKKPSNEERYVLKFNESLLKTMDNSVVRLLDINVHFDADQESWAKVSHDDVRDDMIAMGHIFTTQSMLHEKSAFEGAIRLAVLKRYEGSGVTCKRVSIGDISIVYKG